MALTKAIGLLGGMTWLSTVDYYSILCTKANERAGGRYFPKIYISSINLQKFVDFVETDNHEGNVALLVHEAQKLEAAGSECLAICSNTPHLYAVEIAASIRIPLIHIADATANVISAQGFKRVALLGTRYAMGAAFYGVKLEKHGIELVPLDEVDFEWVAKTIVDELTYGKFIESTRQGYLRLIERLGTQRVQGVILGCTEIPILLKDCTSAIPMFDTMQIHCDEILLYAFES